MMGTLQQTGRYAPAVKRSLHGLFAVYKPPGVHWKLVRDGVETKLLKELNSLKQRAPRKQVRFLLGGGEGGSGAELALVATMLPVLADHRLVKGPNYTHMKVGAGHRLDVASSGVFDHIVREKLERILAIIQGTHQKALLTFSGIDLKSQEAYELAAEGLLRPMNKSPPVITGMRCLHFAPPEFTLEVQCMNETQQYLRKMVHEIGLELKSSAVCTHVRRTRDGMFGLDDALLRTHWDLESIQKAIEDIMPRVELEFQKLDLRERFAGSSAAEGDQQLESTVHDTESR